MAQPTPAAVPGTEVSAEEAEAQALAEERQLEFRARHSLTIDARAHTLLDPRYAREMRAVPLGIEGGRPVVAVADPSEARLEAIRSKVAGDTKFVLVAPESLEALLKSRIFSEGDEGVRARAAAEAALRGAQSAPADHSAPAAPTAHAAAEPAAQPAVEAFDVANVTHLAEQLARAAETLLSLQMQVQGIAAQFEQTRQELREQKERLAAAAAKADQDRARIKSVAASLAEDVARLDQTKADLAERLTGLVQDD
jgi:hypothetical protein